MDQLAIAEELVSVLEPGDLEAQEAEVKFKPRTSRDDSIGDRILCGGHHAGLRSACRN